MTWLLFIFIGFISGCLAGLLGIGGGVLLVSYLQVVGLNYVEAIATSSLAIIITSCAGSWQNWRMGFLDPNKVIALAIPAMVVSLVATDLTVIVSENILQFLFGVLLLVNIYLTHLKNRFSHQENVQGKKIINRNLAIIFTGSLAGFLGGIFGVGGGLVLVPLQMFFLQEDIKSAVRTSLGAIVFISLAASVGHYYNQNVLFYSGLFVGIGGVIGVQITTRFLPKIADKYVQLLFTIILVILAIYSFTLAF